MNRAALELYLAFHRTAPVTLEFLSKRGLTDQAAAEAYRRLQLGSRKLSERRRQPPVARTSDKESTR
jgi:hypothetical protein